MVLKTHTIYYILFIISLCDVRPCDAQDPWDLTDKDLKSKVDHESNIPPDLRMIPRKKAVQTDDNYGIGEWFYRRILSIVLKGGQVKENNDGSVDISLQLKLDQKQRSTLDEYLTSAKALSEDKLRRSLGYIEQSIYEPSLPTKIILAWSDYVQQLLADYKTEITWTLAILAALSSLFWLWKSMSHKNAIIIAFIALYAYEVFISYQEVEKKEIEMFMAAVNSCKWYVWSSQCELPKPDPLIFFKHMNPLKIGIRMFTSIISEPVIILGDTVKTLTSGITDGLWYPFNNIMYGILITFFNIILLILFITIIFNYVLNIPINLGFGLFSVGLRQRNRSLFSDNSNQNHNNKPFVNNTNSVSGDTLDKLLSVLEHALIKNKNIHQIASNSNTKMHITSSKRNIGLKRSASTGRLPNNTLEDYDKFSIAKRNIGFRIDGGGDAR